MKKTNKQKQHRRHQRCLVPTKDLFVRLLDFSSLQRDLAPPSGARAQGVAHQSHQILIGWLSTSGGTHSNDGSSKDLKGRLLSFFQDVGNQAKACSSLVASRKWYQVHTEQLVGFVFNDKSSFPVNESRCVWDRPSTTGTHTDILVTCPGLKMVSFWKGEPFLSSTVFLMVALHIPRKVQRLRLGMEPILTPNPLGPMEVVFLSKKPERGGVIEKLLG